MDSELTVMCDTVRPLLHPTKAGLELDDSAEPAKPAPRREPAALDTSG